MSDKSKLKKTLLTNELKLLTNLSTILRSALIGDGINKKRDYNKEFGYPALPLTPEQYHHLYDTESIAKRIVEVFPDECWSSYPEITENQKPSQTQFEMKWDKLQKKLKLFQMLHRADVQSGIGRFGVMLLGWNDGTQDLSKPVSGIKYDPTTNEYVNTSGKQYDLRYVRVFSEKFCRVTRLDNDPFSDRYGQPVEYEIDLAAVTSYEPNTRSQYVETPEQISASTIGGDIRDVTIKTRVHWHRVFHIADNLKSSEWNGTSRLEQCCYRICDIQKILGGSAEMFWRGAFPGYAFETQPNNEEIEVDETSIAAQMEEYENGLKRYLALEGLTVKPLSPQVASPVDHMEQQLQMICIALGIPMRIFCGSEAGHLASSQDSITWNRRLSARQTNYVTASIIDPFIQRLMLFGALPKVEQFYTKWTDFGNSSETDKADVGLKTAQTILQYVTSGAEEILPVHLFFTKVLGWSDKEAEDIMKTIPNVSGSKAKLTSKIWKQDLSNSKSGKKDPTKKTGKSGNQNGL